MDPLQTRQEPDHLRMWYIPIGISGLFVTNLVLSFMISEELTISPSLGYLWNINMTLLVFPYILASGLILYFGIRQSSEIMHIKPNPTIPLYVLFNCIDKLSTNSNKISIYCNTTNNPWIKTMNIILTIISYLFSMLLAPIIYIFICDDDRYIHIVLTHLILILINTINHIYILFMVSSFHSFLAILTVLSCRITIFYIVLSTFMLLFNNFLPFFFHVVCIRVSI